MRYLLLGVAIVCEIVATLSLRAALDAPGLYAVVGVGYLASFFLLSRVLRLGMPIGVAYGIWGAVGVAATAILSHFLFAEALTPVMLIGIGVVIAGVVTVELGSSRAHRAAETTEPTP